MVMLSRSVALSVSLTPKASLLQLYTLDVSAAHDPICQPKRPSDMHGLQVSPYESLHVMYYTILRGKHVVLTEDSKTHKKTYHPECKTLTLSPI